MMNRLNIKVEGVGPMMFGESLIIDLIDCERIFNRESIGRFCNQMCEVLGMKREKLEFWDYDGQEEEYEAAPDHLKGTTAVQFISTSSITIHTLDVSRQVFIDVFSCKEFGHDKAAKFAAEFFGGKINAQHSLTRG